MKKIFSIIAILPVLWGCNDSAQDGGEITLTGKINFPDSGLVLLEEYGNQEVVVLDTIAVDPTGSFSHQVSPSEPGFYRLNFYGKQTVNLILHQDDLTIEVDGNAPDGKSSITGSTDMDHLNAVNTLVQNFQSKVSEMNALYVQANSNSDQEAMDSIRLQFEAENKKYKAELKEKVKAMGNSLAVLQVVGNFNGEEDFEFLDELGKVFEADPPDTKHTPRFLSFIAEARMQHKNSANLQVGKIAPDINLPNPDGTVVPLSSLRGKVVLIDFWAQWCRPCRMENPNIVDAYSKYRDKGFEVYGVSLDRSRDKWLQGIEEDGLIWTQVSDLKYWQSEAAKTYNITAIPASFLLDQEGKIIAKNLRGPLLHQKLKEILG